MYEKQRRNKYKLTMLQKVGNGLFTNNVKYSDHIE